MPGADHDTQPGCTGAADRALLTIAAQRHVRELLHRVHVGALDAEGLALEVASLDGTGMLAFCRALCRSIEGASDVRP